MPTSSMPARAVTPDPPTARRPARSGRVLRHPAVAAFAVALVLAGAGAAAGNDWFEIFEARRVAPFAVGTSDLVAMPDLSAYGDVVLTGEVDVTSVPDAATAAAETGLDVPAVTSLPRGVRGEPVYQVIDEVSATFTFSADRAAQVAAEHGATVRAFPPGLDGSRVRLVAGPGMAAIWSGSTGVPALVVGRAVAPTALSSGVPLDTMRDSLLSLPGLSDEVATQLRALSSDGSTLPLPVPADEMTTSSADVHGVPATVLVSRDRLLTAVVWIDDGVVTVVAGSLDPDEVLSIAAALR